MPRTLGTLIAAIAFLSMGMSVPYLVLAENLRPTISTLGSYQDFLFGVQEVRENIDTVQCGGWENTGGTATNGTIPTPTISGVPGRSHDPLGDPETGVGTRDDFSYPESARGIMSACDIRETHVNPDRLCLKSSNKATPTQCMRLYQRLTQTLPAFTNPELEAQGFCKDADGNYCFQYTSICRGAECASREGPPAFSCGGTNTIPASFYRHYDTTVTTTDGQEWNFGTECYEYYDTRDPQRIVTGFGREQCEFDVTPDHPLPEWDDGSGRQRGMVSPQPPIVEDPSQERQTVDPWKPDTHTNLTLPDFATWSQQRSAEGGVPQLSDLLSLPIESTSKASQTSPPYSKTDAFDDTAERDFVSFWEEEQRELLRLTRDPEVTVLLPALYLHNLSFDDPLFEAIHQVTERPSGLVSVTLRSGLEDLGHVLASFAESRIVRLDEVRIPILLPVAGDIDARIGQWKQWKELETQHAKETGRTSYADAADENIAILEDYRERIESARVLRGSILQLTQRLLEHTRQIRERMADEYKERAEAIVEIQEAGKSRKELQVIWQLIQRSLLLAEECQLLWCSNQRFSAPVYSLLDEWWGERQPNEQRDLSYRPESIRSLNLPPSNDYVFDFSDFSFSGSAITIPVFDPIQVRLTLPLPPLVGTQPTSTDAYPSLPPLPTDTEFLGQPLPSIDMATLPAISVPPPPDLEEAKRILREVRYIIDGIPIDFQQDQENFVLSGGSMDDLWGPSFDRYSLLGSMCRFPYSVTIPRIDDETSDPLRIVHVENDLRERLSRLFARWMPNRTEDFSARVLRLTSDPPDTTCHEGVLCLVLPLLQKVEPSYAWFVPRTVIDSAPLVDAMRERTLPASNDQNPYFFAPTNILRRIFPTVPLPTRPILHSYD